MRVSIRQAARPPDKEKSESWRMAYANLVRRKQQMPKPASKPKLSSNVVEGSGVGTIDPVSVPAWAKEENVKSKVALSGTPLKVIVTLGFQGVVCPDGGP